MQARENIWWVNILVMISLAELKKPKTQKSYEIFNFDFVQYLEFCFRMLEF